MKIPERRPGKQQQDVPFVQQRGPRACGTTCLAMIFKYYGMYNITTLLDDLAQVGSHGTDLYILSEIAGKLGFTSEGWSVEYEELSQLTLPCVAHFSGDHFVVVARSNPTHVWIVDPAVGKQKLTREEFLVKWNGVILTVEPTDEVFQNPDLLDLVEAYRKQTRQNVRAFCLSLLKPFRAVLAQLVLLSLLLQGLGLGIPFVTQSIIDRALVYKDQQILFVILLAMICIFIMQLFLSWARSLIMAQLKARFELDFFSRFISHLLQLKQSYFDLHKHEGLVARFQESHKLRSLISVNVIQAFLSLFMIVVYMVVLFLYHTMLAGLALGCLFLFTGATLYFGPRLKSLENKMFHANAHTMGNVLDSLQGFETVKLLGLEHMRYWQWKGSFIRALNKTLDMERTHIAMTAVHGGLSSLSQIAVLWLGAFYAFSGSLTIGQYVAFNSIFGQIIGAVSSITTLVLMFARLSVTFDRLNDVLSQERESTDLAALETEIGRGRIELRGVSFCYPGEEERDVVRNVSVMIEPGESIGVVGRNGSGKSTLVKLLVGLYDTYSGTIHINGVDLRKAHPYFLRKKVFLLSQSCFLFSGTIKENIQLANPHATVDEIVQAAKLADAHDFIRRHYLGYNHKLETNGANLSGGQRAKVALARLFLSDPEVLVLDEATSALDVETEQRVLRSIGEHFRDRTVIFITHRIYTLRHCDRILVLDNDLAAESSLVEVGTHNDLMASKGLYFSFVKAFGEMVERKEERSGKDEADH